MNQDVIRIERDPEQLDWLSDAAQRWREDARGLALPWSLTLCLQALAETEDDDARVEGLRARLPMEWTEDDEELLIEAVLGLELPPLCEPRLRLKAKGTAGRPGYVLSVSWVDARALPIRVEPTRDGGRVRWGDGPWRRLSVGQLALLEAHAQLPAMGADRAHDLLVTDRLKALVPEGDPRVVFDRFLARQTVVEVGQVTPFLEPIDEGREGYRVRPRIEGVEGEALERYFDARPTAGLGEDVLPIVDGERRTRVIFNARAAAALRDLRCIERLSPAQAAAALSDPRAFFGVNIDTRQLSERVVGFGPQIRTATPRARELKDTVEWLDWPLTLSQVGGGDDDEASPSLQLRDADTRAWLRDAIEAARAEGHHFIVLPDGDLLEITQTLLEALAAAEASESRRLEREGASVLQIQDNLEDVQFHAPMTAPEVRDALHRPPALREGFELFPYQVEGYTWLVSRSGVDAAAPNHNGALLADDMGLGKTLQVLSMLSYCVTHGRGGPHLVVAPIALLANWKAEAARFFGDHLEPIFRVQGRTLPALPGDASALLAKQRVVLVSYETLRRHELSFAGVDWHTVVLDEAQKAKNPDTQISRVLRTLKARFRLAMTGTPVENSLTELWCLFDWLAPGHLGSLRRFTDHHITPLQEDYEGRAEALAEQLHERIRPFFLRRTKKEVLSDRLPPMYIEHHHVGMSTEQSTRYHEQVARAEKTGQTLAYLTRLFGVCAHPHMMDAGVQLPALSEVNFPKAAQLFSLLDEVAARRERVLIFVNRRRLQRWLAAQIKARYGTQAPVINGSITGSERRMRIVDDFSATEGFAALVLAPRAAGMGLNITAANHVIHYTREWNPAVENQATDRAYRIGQTRPVHVHHIIATGQGEGVSVEELLDQLLEAKRQLMNDFVVPMGRPEVGREELARSLRPRR